MRLTKSSFKQVLHMHLPVDMRLITRVYDMVQLITNLITGAALPSKLRPTQNKSKITKSL